MKAARRDSIDVLSLKDLQDDDTYRSAQQKLRAAVSEVGSIVLTDHGIEDQVGNALSAYRRLFRSESAEKDRLSHATGASQECGYGVVNHERTMLALDGVNERALSQRHEYYNVRHLEGHNRGLWPRIDNFAGPVTQLYRGFEAVLHELTEALEDILSVERGAISDLFVGHDTLMTANYYPAIPALSRNPGHRKGAHRDWSFLTLLVADSFDGLEFHVENIGWCRVPDVTNALVVTVGDLLQKWTNSHMLSAPHRVRLTTADVEQPSRLSVAFFAQPEDSVTIDVFPCCRSEAVSDAVPTTVGQFINTKAAQALVVSRRYEARSC